MHGSRLSFDKLDLDYLHNYKTAGKKKKKFRVQSS